MSRHFGGVGPGRQVERARMFVVLGILLVIVIAGASLILLSVGSSGTNTTASVVVQKEELTLQRISVLVPKQRIETGLLLEPFMFQEEQRAMVGLPPKERLVTSFDQIRGYYSRSPIIPGEPLLTDVITSVRPSNPVSAKIPEGYRAVTINVNSTSSVEGWATPGAKVDVVWASRIRGQAGVSVIVQNAEVLSAERMVDPNLKPGTPVPSTVTLLVTADDANKIMLATTTGALSLSLRGDQDTGKGVGGGSITVDSLLNGADTTSKTRSKGITVKVKGPDGKIQEMELIDGKLVPMG